MSAALVKLQRKGQMVIPRSLREEAGVVEGTLMKVAVVNGGRFLVTPQVSIDRAIVANPRKTRKQVLRELAATVAELRREAKAKSLDKLSVREIDATVAAARQAHETAKQRAKRSGSCWTPAFSSLQSSARKVPTPSFLI